MFDKLILTALLLAAAVLLLRLIRHSRRAMASRRAARAGYLDACQPLFSDLRRSIGPSGFARQSGRYRGRMFDLQVVADTLATRKLPTLWLLVSLPEPMPVAATWDLMQRPTGIESFSHFARLPFQQPLPAGMPDTAALRSDAALPMPEPVRSQLDLFDDPRAKELLISPRGLRLVWLVEEADRGRYLIFRDAEMGHVPLDAAMLPPLLNRLTALAEALTKALTSPLQTAPAA